MQAAWSDLPPAEVRGTTYCDDDELRRARPNHLAMRHSQAVRKKIATIPSAVAARCRIESQIPEASEHALLRASRSPAHYKYPQASRFVKLRVYKGFPDDFRIYGSSANQMMQVTNAVPPPLASLTVVLQVLTEFTGLAHGSDS